MCLGCEMAGCKDFHPGLSYLPTLSLEFNQAKGPPVSWSRVSRAHAFLLSSLLPSLSELLVSVSWQQCVDQLGGCTEPTCVKWAPEITGYDKSVRASDVKVSQKLYYILLELGSIFA